jgi:hypothetical protein
MLEAGTKANAIAKKLKRTVGAIHSRAKMIRKISDQQKAEDKIQSAAKSPDSTPDIALAAASAGWQHQDG